MCSESPGARCASHDLACSRVLAAWRRAAGARGEARAQTARLVKYRKAQRRFRLALGIILVHLSAPAVWGAPTFR